MLVLEIAACPGKSAALSPNASPMSDAVPLWGTVVPFFVPGKSHPRTKNTSVGGNFRRTFRTIGHTNFPPGNSYGPIIAQSSLKVFSLDRYWSIECSSLWTLVPVSGTVVPVFVPSLRVWGSREHPPKPPEFAQPRLSRVKERSSPSRGYKFGCVCSYMASHYVSVR